jgi:hypothetical protein
MGNSLTHIITNIDLFFCTIVAWCAMSCWSYTIFTIGIAFRTAATWGIIMTSARTCISFWRIWLTCCYTCTIFLCSIDVYLSKRILTWQTTARLATSCTPRTTSNTISCIVWISILIWIAERHSSACTFAELLSSWTWFTSRLSRFNTIYKTIVRRTCSDWTCSINEDNLPGYITLCAWKTVCLYWTIYTTPGEVA